MKPVTIIRHENWINAGHLLSYLQRHGIPVQWVKIDQNEALPTHLGDTSGLIFLGCTMSVNDDFPWIKDELNLIRLAEEQNLPVLGHCFGSQLISKALGGVVAPMRAKEIGWHKIKQSNNPVASQWLSGLPQDTEILIWHHEEFSIPDGAFPLYESSFCKNQAFVFGKMLAIVAHLECTESMLNEWLDIYGYDINPVCESTQELSHIKSGMIEKINSMHLIAEKLYARWTQWLQWEQGALAGGHQ